MLNIYSTITETSLRILIILSLYNEKTNIDTLTTIDFMATFGKYFDVSKNNLHGDNNFSYGEFTSRRELIKQSIQFLLKHDYIKTINSSNGINYNIFENVNEIVNNLTSSYSQAYKETVKSVLSKYKNYIDNNNLINLILTKH